MSSIAQKLCDEICEKSPTKPLSKQNISVVQNKSSRPSSSRYNGRATRSIVVEKKKVINKVVPSSISCKSKVINKFKSKETIINKTFVDTGLNTVITGPLRNDNDCVTMVRRRDPKSPCKCNNKGLKCKMSTKEIQTFDVKHFSNLDKACTQCVETVNCGTQFFERMNSRSKMPSSLRSKVKLSSETNTQPLTIENTIKESQRYAMNNNESSIDPTIYNYMGARRWALSHHPTRGPDF